MYTVLLGLGKSFECLNLHLFAAHSNLNFSSQSFAAMSTSIFAHVHLYDLNM